MRWDALFDDLEAQLEQQVTAERWGEVAERTRAEAARLQPADRLRAHVGQSLSLRLRDGLVVRGQCLDAGVEWAVIAGGEHQLLVPFTAVSTVSGLSRAVAAEPGAVVRRLGLPHALRALARGRVPVRVRFDGGELTGTVDRVGADHFDLAEHAPDEPRRASVVRQVTSIRTGTLLLVTGTGLA